MASTTKIMTALIAIERCDLQEPVIISPLAAGVEGSSVYLQAGEQQTVENLLYALLLESANDAAVALAIHIAGSTDGFAACMNDRAKEMNLTDTHFTNPHGLHDAEHYTTARDLARITAEAMQNATFRTIVSTKRKVISMQNGATQRTLSNHNRLLRSYADCIGVKTGYTKVSGRCLVSAAEKNGLLLIAVTLDAPGDWQDHTALLNYGFSCYEGRSLDEYLGTTMEVPVLGGTKEVVLAGQAMAQTVILPRGASPLTATWEINHYALAPIRKGDVLGVIRYQSGQDTVAVVPLLATESIPAAPIHYTLWDKIKQKFNW